MNVLLINTLGELGPDPVQFEEAGEEIEMCDYPHCFSELAESGFLPPSEIWYLDFKVPFEECLTHNGKYIFVSE